MPIPTPFHPRTSELCTSLLWKEWAGYHAVCSYGISHEREYFAIRQAAALIDVTPLCKVEVAGPDAGAFLARVMVKDPRRLKLGRVTYLCWCDDDGKVIDDGTVSRLEEDRFRVTSNHPCAAWLQRQAGAYRVTITDVSQRLATLALQGPASRDLLRQVCDADLDRLRFFRWTRARLDRAQVMVSRTGYTGDLGYEIWIERDDALAVWDALMALGRAYRLEPAGLDAMDVTRVEAGFVLNGVDYWSAHLCLDEQRKTSPFELGLGFTVQLEREPFVGQEALRRERERGSRWARVGLVIDWDAFETLYAEYGLPPGVPARAWRESVPLYDRRWTRRQIGQATSGAWSPILKRNLAIATVDAAHAAPETRVLIEVTPRYARRQVPATVVPTPFFDPERKRS